MQNFTAALDPHLIASLLRFVHLTLGFILFGGIAYLGYLTSSTYRKLPTDALLAVVPATLVSNTRWVVIEGWLTVASGLILAAFKIGFVSSAVLQDRNWLIMLSLGLGLTILILLHIQFWILPAHRKIRQALSQAEAGEEGALANAHILMLRARRTAHLDSYLAVLVLATMVGAVYWPIF